MKMVLQKFIADSGLCSRRQAEELIKAGKVKVNGERAGLGARVDGGDEVVVGGKKIGLANKKIYIILNKPKGYTCTSRKFKGEKNVFDLLNKIPSREGWMRSGAEQTGCVTVDHGHTPRRFAPPLSRGELLRLFVVGRLDKDSRGLVLLTNDGKLAQKFTHPKFEHEKRYIVETQDLASNKIIQNSKFKNQKFNSKLKKIIIQFSSGIDIGDGDGIVRAKKIKYLGDNTSASSVHSKFEIVLTEGKKRQIRRMFKAVGYEVADLVRTAIGKLELGNLPEGKWRYLNDSEMKKINI